MKRPSPVGDHPPKKLGPQGLETPSKSRQKRESAGQCTVFVTTENTEAADKLSADAIRKRLNALLPTMDEPTLRKLLTLAENSTGGKSDA